MERIYVICMIIGITIPLFSLLLHGIMDFLGGIFDGLSGLFDGLSHFDTGADPGDPGISLFPISVQSICAGLLVFGSAGKIAYGNMSVVWVNIMSAVLGYAAALVIQNMIRRLKSVQNTTQSQEQLVLLDASVVNTIMKDGFGSISVRTADGITRSFPAKALESGLVIRQDAMVTIVRFDKNVAIVKEKPCIEEHLKQ